jgi:hypothetical protein
MLHALVIVPSFIFHDNIITMIWFVLGNFLHSLCLQNHDTKTCWGDEIQHYVLLTSALDGYKLFQAPTSLSPGK